MPFLPIPPGATPWRPPRVGGTPADRSRKWLTIHFEPVGEITQPPITEHLIIRWELPYPNDPEDNAYGIMGERSTFWIPRHAIRPGDSGQDHPDFNRSGIGDRGPTETEEELWNLWQ